MSSETQSKVSPSLLGRVWLCLVTLIIYVRWSFKVFMMSNAFIVIRIIFFLSRKQKQNFAEVMNEVAHLDGSNLEVDDWRDTFFTFAQLKTSAKMLLLNFYKTARLHGPPINVDVITLEGNPAKLLDYSSDPNRPLVVNFGSCT